MRSPGAVRGTNTARPSASRPTPSPPAAIPEIVTRSFTQTLPQARLYPEGTLERGNVGRCDRSRGTAAFIGQQRGRDGDRPLEPGERRRCEHALAHAFQVRDVDLPP